MENGWTAPAVPPIFATNHFIMRLLHIPVIALLALAACTGGDAKTGSVPASVPASAGAVVAAQQGDDQEWRNVDTAWALIQGVAGRTVADLAAGDGYYTWRLLAAGAKVIAVDEDPANLAAIEARKAELGIGDDRLRTRLAAPGSTGLGANEADLAFIVQPYGTILNRANYFREVRSVIRAPHQVMIINYLQGSERNELPAEQRANEMHVMDELGSFGYADVVSMSKLLPERYMVVAQDLPPGM